MFPQIQPNKKRWLARKIIPLAQQGTVTDNPPFSHNGRDVATASIIDTWSLVIAIPLFVSVGVQDNVTPPPPVDQTVQTTIHINWLPPAWDTQKTRKVPTSGPSTTTQPSYTRNDFLIFTTWYSPPLATPYWTTQGAQAGADVQYPKVSYTNDGRVPSMVWEPLTWDAQTTRKVPQVPPVVIPPGPSPHRPYVELARWDAVVPTPLWQTFGAQSSTPTVNNPPPTNNNIETLLGTWPQPAWDTQITRKTPIPNVLAVPFTNATYQAINQWQPLDWPTQVTRKFPVPSQAPQVDNPPPRTISYPIYDRWFNRPTHALWQPLAYRDGPTVVPPDSPPLRIPFTAAIYTAWEPRPPEPVWSWRLIDLSRQPAPNLDWFETVYEAWLPPVYDQPRRRFVTASGVIVINNPPFSSRRPNQTVYDLNWPPADWPGQHAPFQVQSGIDAPPITDLMRRRHLDVITRMWETIPDVAQRRPTANPQAVLFRRTLSQLGTGVGHRQPHGWT